MLQEKSINGSGSNSTDYLELLRSKKTEVVIHGCIEQELRCKHTPTDVYKYLLAAYLIKVCVCLCMCLCVTKRFKT